mmetsp:Transcript_2368/g.6117  ORF Transcript_2368/g.6117 Transcript_2368/m.6117 type:complete len:223 (+) Transcript_2368:67-735(+)
MLSLQARQSIGKPCSSNLQKGRRSSLTRLPSWPACQSRSKQCMRSCKGSELCPHSCVRRRSRSARGMRRSSQGPGQKLLRSWQPRSRSWRRCASWARSSWRQHAARPQPRQQQRSRSWRQQERKRRRAWVLLKRMGLRSWRLRSRRWRQRVSRARSSWQQHTTKPQLSWQQRSRSWRQRAQRRHRNWQRLRKQRLLQARRQASRLQHCVKSWRQRARRRHRS